MLTYRTPGPLFFPQGKGFGDSPDTPVVLPSWLTDEDVDYFVSKFEKTGFTGGVNYYRALNNVYLSFQHYLNLVLYIYIYKLTHSVFHKLTVLNVLSKSNPPWSLESC